METAETPSSELMKTQVSSLKKREVLTPFLAILSGVLLGISFPPSPFYSFAFVAFIPLFFVLIQQRSFLQAARFLYLFLVVFHLCTLYWTGGFVVGKDVWMMTAGVAVLFVHPLFYLPFLLLSTAAQKYISKIFGLVTFALAWVSFEYLHSQGEYSFPWVTIGNSQAYDLPRIQIVEYISIYGLSLLILAFNIIAFVLLWKITNKEWTLRSRAFFILSAVLAGLYFIPFFYGTNIVQKEFDAREKSLLVGVIQPNIDPWEKWGSGSGKQISSLEQFQILLKETKEIAHSDPELIIWPETAIPFYIQLPRYEQSFAVLHALVDSLKIPIFTGVPTLEYFQSKDAPATAQQIGISDMFVESYNSAMLLQPGTLHTEIHRKTILVPFAERIPYAETFRFLIEPLKWNVGISSWGKGSDTLVFPLTLRDGSRTKFGGMICYESAYPNYVREFVLGGAEFLIVVTNDSWWGKTSGAYQHASFAAIRAVETRRWIIQCANGGISMIVDPTGKSYSEKDLYTKAKIIDKIRLRTEKTFYVRFGDRIAQSCLVCAVLIIGMVFLQRKRLHRAH